MELITNMRSLVGDNDAREGSVPVGDNSRRWRGAARENINIILSHILQRFSPLVSSVGPGYHLIRVQAGNVECEEPETSQYNNTRLSSVPGSTSPSPDLNPAPQLDTDNVRTWRYDQC